MSLVSAAITGNYETIGNPADATHVIGLSFGHRGGIRGSYEPGPTNERLASFLSVLSLQHEGLVEVPWYLQQEVAAGLPLHTKQPVSISKPSDPSKSYLDSWDVLSQAKKMTAELGGDYGRPLIIGQAHHIGRVAAQARKMGDKPIIPKNLPDTFDGSSVQWWTRSRHLWVVREIPGLAILKKRGQL